MAADPYKVAIERLVRLAAPPRLSAEPKARTAAALPKEGEVKGLTAVQREKIEAVAPVLKAHGREDDYLLKVVESRQARVAIYARSVVLITETALRVLSPTQLQALVAHEIGHELIWDEFEEARKKGDYARLRELELVCDGVAVLTLHRIGAPAWALIDGLLELTNSNRLNGLEEGDSRSYPTLLERVHFPRLVTPR